MPATATTTQDVHLLWLSATGDARVVAARAAARVMAAEGDTGAAMAALIDVLRVMEALRTSRPPLQLPTLS